jgi:translation initiation factor 3 subunit G
MTSGAARWGDDFDDSDDEQQHQEKEGGGRLVIPPTHKSRIDSKGIQIITSYRANPSNPNQLYKTVTKQKVTSSKIREARDVERRCKWKKFGQAASGEDTSNVTIPTREDIMMEDPHADTDLQDDDPGKALAGNLNAFWAKQQRRQLQRKYDVDAPEEEEEEEGGGGWTQVGASASAAAATTSTGKYVPPSIRAGKSGGSTLPERRTDDLNTIRVTNISESTTEADLQDLFQPFGRISRVYLAKDKETMLSRGFAFVSFVHREEAATAMENLQGFGYDHLILKLEWARPSAPKDPASSGTEFRSGYGKALAQDTKEKVSYASNLTRGVR